MEGYSSIEEAAALVQSGQRIFGHGSACTPNIFYSALAKRAQELENVELVSITQQGPVEIANPEYAGSFHIRSLFTSEPVRKAVNGENGDYVPIFLSGIPHLFRNGILPLDVAVVTVSPPDEHGYCTLGTSIDCAQTAVHTAKTAIAIVNPNMPRTYGDSAVHKSRFAKMVWHDAPLITLDYGAKVTDVERKIGQNVAEIIDDKATLQMGIGTIPDAVLKSLSNHKGLGIHTEMLSDGVIDLIEKGVVTNAHKGFNNYKTVTSFSFGTKKLYDFLHNNPIVSFYNVELVNSPAMILRNKRMHAINSAVEVDLTGQVCADSIGTYQFSGIGGQMDFMTGAAYSEGGKPIIAISSRTNKGIPRIVPVLNPGAGVVTTRGHVHYVVTEYGTVNLFGKGLKERAKALISIAHPDDREALTKAAYERFKVSNL